MKHLQFLLCLLFLTMSIPASAQTKRNVNPVYIANMLVDNISLDEMRETCLFYNLKEISSDDGYMTFIDARGNTIRFKDAGNREIGANGRLIELHTRDNIKTIERILKDTGYRKQADVYERGARITNSLTQCQLRSKGQFRMLSFHKVKNKRVED